MAITLKRRSVDSITLKRRGVEEPITLKRRTPSSDILSALASPKAMGEGIKTFAKQGGLSALKLVGETTKGVLKTSEKIPTVMRRYISSTQPEFALSKTSKEAEQSAQWWESPEAYKLLGLKYPSLTAGAQLVIADIARLGKPETIITAMLGNEYLYKPLVSSLLKSPKISPIFKKEIGKIIDDLPIMQKRRLKGMPIEEQVNYLRDKGKLAKAIKGNPELKKETVRQWKILPKETPTTKPFIDKNIPLSQKQITISRRTVSPIKKLVPKTKVDPLIQEAKKYKSAEEFVAINQEKPLPEIPNLPLGNKDGILYRGMSMEEYKSGNFGKYKSIVPDEAFNYAKTNAKMGKGSPTYKDTSGKAVFAVFDKGELSKAFEVNKSGDIKQIFGETELIVTKSQLTDIWNKANKPQPTSLQEEAKKFKSAEELATKETSLIKTPKVKNIVEQFHQALKEMTNIATRNKTISIADEQVISNFISDFKDSLFGRIGKISSEQHSKIITALDSIIKDAVQNLNKYTIDESATISTKDLSKHADSFKELMEKTIPVKIPKIRMIKETKSGIEVAFVGRIAREDLINGIVKLFSKRKGYATGFSIPENEYWGDATLSIDGVTKQEFLDKISTQKQSQLTDIWEKAQGETTISAREAVAEPEMPIQPTEQGAIIKRSQIMENMSEKLGVPIRKGHYRLGWGRKALGIYKPQPDIIRWKNGGVGTVSHEVGHFLDDNFSDLNYLIQSNKAELGKLDYFPDKGRANEGFSEYLRYWVTHPEVAAGRAPKFAPEFDRWLDNNPDIKDVLVFSRDQYQSWLKMPSVDKVKSQISFHPKDVAKSVKSTIDDIYSMSIDDLAPIQRYADLAKQQGIQVTDDENPYILARLHKGWVGKANYFLQNNTFNTKLEDTGKGLKEILKPAEKSLEDLSTYLVARRVPGLARRSKVTGIAAEDAKIAIRDLEAKHPQFKQIAGEIYDYQDKLLTYAYDNGLLSRASIQKMKLLNRNYVPFYRVFEELQRQGFAGSKFANVASPIKRIKGSEREIIDPLENIVKNTYAIINAADRNAVARGIVELSRKDRELGRLVEKISTPMTKVAKVDLGKEIKKLLKDELDIEDLDDMDFNHIIDIFRPSMFMPNESIITVMNGGKKQFYYVDPELYKSLLGMNKEETGMLIKLLSYPAKWLRAGATTLSPEFIARNPLRDQLSAYVYSKTGYVPMVDLAKGIFSLIGRDKYYDAWVKGGGLHSTLVSVDRNYMRQNLQELFGKNWKQAINPLRWFQALSEWGEQGTRLGEARRALRKGKTPKEAAITAREVTLDFARMGSKITNWNKITAFANANIQGLNRPFQAFREAPGTTWAKILTGITLPSIALYLINRDDEEYKEFPHWQRDLFWLIKVGKGREDGVLTSDEESGIAGQAVKPFITREGSTWLRIPKPFELGIIFGTVPERILEYLDTKDPKSFDKLASTVLEGAYINPTQWIPTALKPPLENMTNYNFFRERKLETMGMERLLPEERYTQFTSETAKKLGRLLGMSPVKIENMVRGYAAAAGNMTLGLLDILIGAERKLPMTAENAPVIKGLIAREPVGSSSVSVNGFYENYDRINEVVATIDTLRKKGDLVRADNLRKNNPEATPFISKMARKKANELSDNRKRINNILDNENMSKAEKLRRIREISIKMTTTAKRFNDLISEKRKGIQVDEQIILKRR